MSDSEKVDVNDMVREEWKEDTTAFQRVKSVISREYEGKTASEIAEDALVAEATARSHLEDLVDDGYVNKSGDPERNASIYARSWESYVFEQAQDMVEHADSDELLEKVTEIEAEIDGFREETGLDSPEDIAWSDVDVDEERLLQWRTSRRNLRFVQLALAMDRAGDVVKPSTKA